jgi:hypothetical protein
VKRAAFSCTPFTYSANGLQLRSNPSTLYEALAAGGTALPTLAAGLAAMQVHHDVNSKEHHRRAKGDRQIFSTSCSRSAVATTIVCSLIMVLTA